MKTNYPIFLLIFLNSLIYSQVSTEWVGIYSRLPQSVNSPKDIVSDNDNNVFVTGSTRSQGYGSEKFVVIKYSPVGIQEWVRVLPGFGIGQSIAIDSDGFIIAGGQMKDTFNIPDDYCVVKLDQSGNILWLSRYDGPLQHFDYGEYMIIDSSNNIYITGTSSDTVTYYATIKYSPDGLQQWAKRYKFRNGGGLNSPVRLALDISGNLYLSAHQLFAVTDEDFLLVKYDNNGNQIWTRNYNSPGDSTDYCVNIAVDETGNIIVAGLTNAFGLFICKYNRDGDLVWSTPYLSGNYYYGSPSQMVIDSYSNIYIAGQVNSQNYGNILVVKYDSNGSKLWEKSYNGSDNQDEKANDIVIDKNGFIISTGYIVNSNANHADYFTVKLDPAGNQLWSTTYNAPLSSGDVAYCLTATNSNKIVVSGQSSILPLYTTSITTIQYGETIGIDPVSSEIPFSFGLFQNFPNPFNPETVIKYHLPKDVKINIRIFDYMGREVTAIVSNKFTKAGSYEIIWNASEYASGVYFYRIDAGEYYSAKKMVLLK